MTGPAPGWFGPADRPGVNGTPHHRRGTMHPNTVETEVKFHVSDPDAVRRNLQAVGAESRGRCGEHNVRFDTPDERLRRARSLLRLRQDRACTLTFKAPAPAADPA